MAWGAVIAALGSVLGSGASAYGSGAFGGGPKPPNAGIKKGKNRLYNATLIDALIGMGVPISQKTYGHMSPFNRVGLSSRQLTEVRDLVREGHAAGQTPDQIAKSLEAFGMRDNGKESAFYDKKGRFVGAKMGFSSLGELVSAELASNERYNPDEMEALAATTAGGRRDAQRAIAGIQGDFVAPTAADIQEQAGIAETAFRGQITRERADRERALLEQANTMEINPAARLGRLDEWQAQMNLEAQPQGLARALQLLSGQQGLQTNALGALQTSLGNQVGAATNLQSLGNQSFQQAMALYQAQSAQRAQGFDTLGAGIANAGNLAGQAIFMRNQDAAPGEPVKNWEWEQWLKDNG
jgi:hypothetical protein